MHYVHLIVSCFVSAHHLVGQVSPFRVYTYYLLFTQEPHNHRRH